MAAHSLQGGLRCIVAIRPVSSELPQASSGPLTATHDFTVDTKLNILIPMSGAGRRFKEAGYTMPKPLLDVFGKPMIQRVVENIALEGQYIFIVKSDLDASDLLSSLCPGCIIVTTDVLTEGAACSTLLAKEHINNTHPLLIANSDQLVSWKPEVFLSTMKHADAGILTFPACEPKWSYVRVGEDGLVKEVAEKKVISNTATVGIYYYRKGSDYVRYAEQMIAKNILVNGEFYVAPVFNEYIADGKVVLTHPCEEMHGLGTPEDLAAYLK